MSFKPGSSPLSITIIYISIGLLWFFFGDFIFSKLAIDVTNFGYLQEVEGICFVLVTGGLVYYLIRRYAREHEEYEHKLEETLEEKETFIKEVHRKVKENSAMISGLTELKDFEIKNKQVRILLEDSLSRIQLVAFVHENLYQSESFQKISTLTFVENLVDDIQSKFNSTQNDIVVIQKVERFTFDLQQAITCALLLNELITNVYHHAFTEQKKGKMYVKMFAESDGIHIIIEDNGKGLPKEFKPSSKKTVGFTLVQVLVKQLQGKINYKSKPGTGTRFHITFPTETMKSYNSLNEHWAN